MNRLMCMLTFLLAALMFAPAVTRADTILAFGFRADSPDDGYAVQTGGETVALIDQRRGITVVLHRLAKVPDATAEAVTKILERYRDTKSIEVARAVEYQRHGTRGVFAEGTATIADVESRYWFLVTGVDNRVILAVAHAPADTDALTVVEIETILESVRPEGVYFDFSTPGLSNEWGGQGKITVERSDPPEPYEPADADDETAEDDFVPQGPAVRIQTEGQGVFFTRPDRVPRDWTAFESVSFWLFRDDANEAPTTIEFQALEDSGPKRYWRKIVVDHEGWKKYSVPLRWSRRTTEGVASWERIGRLAFWFRDSGDLWIDSIALHDVDPEVGAMLTVADLTPLAFPQAGNEPRVEARQAVTLITDVNDLDVNRLSTHLQKVHDAVARDLPLPPSKESSQGPFLVIASTRDNYRRFVANVAVALNGQIELPRSDGFTFHGLATSYWEPKFGSLRPVYTHEYVHAMLAEALRFDNKGEWLHEGLGTYYQLKFHPQDNLNQIVQQGLENPDYRHPLQELCNGESIPTTRYWQAMTVVELLLSEPKYRERLPKLIEAMLAARSTNLGPHLEPVLNSSWKQLTSDWQAHCRARFGKDES